MYSQIIGTQQIVVTTAFLAFMIILLIILRRKGSVIRASLKAGKRITVVEDTAVSPTDRLRLISVDNSEFLMLSAKGHAPVLIAFTSGKTTPVYTQDSRENAGLAEIDESPELSSISPKNNTTGDKLYPSPDERAAFIKKFQSWRRDNVAG